MFASIPGRIRSPVRAWSTSTGWKQVPVGVLVQRLGRLAGERLHAVCNAVAIAVNCADR